MSEITPGIGRIVHVWVPDVSRWLPGIVTNPSESGLLDVLVFGLSHRDPALLHEDVRPQGMTEEPKAFKEGGSLFWRWPPRGPS